MRTIQWEKAAKKIAAEPGICSGSWGKNGEKSVGCTLSALAADRRGMIPKRWGGTTEFFTAITKRVRDRFGFSKKQSEALLHLTDTEWVMDQRGGYLSHQGRRDMIARLFRDPEFQKRIEAIQ